MALTATDTSAKPVRKITGSSLSKAFTCSKNAKPSIFGMFMSLNTIPSKRRLNFESAAVGSLKH